MRSVNGSVAVITGAGSGIGRATAIALARKGAALALSDVDEKGLAGTVELLPPGTHVTTRKVDVAKIDEMTAWAAEVEKHFGRASILVNNAGVALYGFYEDYSRADLEWVMNVNFWGPVNGAEAFMPLLKREPAANIVTVSSVYGIIAPPGNVAYAASKFAVRGFYEGLRHELRETPIRVTVVHPGGIATNIAKTSRAAARADTSNRAADIERFSKLLRMPPEKAADLIVASIEKDKPRLLIGAEAYVIDFMQRLSPAGYIGIMRKLFPAGDAIEIRKERERERLAAESAPSLAGAGVGV